MTWEQIAAGLQIAAIIAIVIGACLAPFVYSFFKNKE